MRHTNPWWALLALAILAATRPAHAECRASPSGVHSFDLRVSARAGGMCLHVVDVYAGVGCAGLEWSVTLACNFTERLAITDHGRLISILAPYAARRDWDILRVTGPAGSAFLPLGELPGVAELDGTVAVAFAGAALRLHGNEELHVSFDAIEALAEARGANSAGSARSPPSEPALGAIFAAVAGAVDLAATPEHTLVALLADGSAVEIDGAGSRRPFQLPGGRGLAAGRVTISDGRVAVAAPKGVVIQSRHGGEGAVFPGEYLDVIDGCAGLIALGDDRVVRIGGKSGPDEPWRAPGHGLVGIAARDCDEAFVWTADEVWAAGRDQVSAITRVAAPVRGVAVAGDAVYLLHGDPERVSRLDGLVVASVPGARALVAGNGGALGTGTLYVAAPDAILMIRP